MATMHRIGSVATFQIQQAKTSAALERYRQRQEQETEILDARVMHRNALKRINTRVLRAEKEIARLEGDPTQADRVAALRRELVELHDDKSQREDAFLRQIAYLEASLVVLDDEQLGLIRGYEAQRGIVEFRERDKHGRALREQWKSERREFVSHMFSFFEAHGTKRFEDLRHSDIEDLRDVFRGADVNVTKEVERQDVESVLRRCFHDTGVSNLELVRIMLLLGYEPLTQFSLGLPQFFRLGCELVPLAKRKIDEFHSIGKLDAKGLAARRKAAGDRDEWDSAEFRFRESIAKLEGQLAANPDDELLGRTLHNERMSRRDVRIAWAQRACILTAFEESRYRAAAAARYVDRHPFEPLPFASTAAAPLHSTSSDLSSRRVAIPPPRKPKPPPPSVALVEDRKRRALREAFERAPLTGTVQGLDGTQAADMKELYAMICQLDLDGCSEGLTASAVANFLSMYWRTGADLDDGVLFVTLHAPGAPAVSYENFVAAAPRLRELTQEQASFDSMSLSAKRTHIATKVQQGDRLRRFERDFQRCDEHCRLESHERATKNQPGTSSFLSNRSYLFPPSQQKDTSPKREEVDWHASSTTSPQSIERVTPGNTQLAVTARSNDVQLSTSSPDRSTRVFRSPRTNRSTMSPRSPQYHNSVQLPYLAQPAVPRTDRLVSLTDYRHIQDGHFLDLLRLTHGI